MQSDGDDDDASFSSLDDSQLEAELERQLAEMSDIDLSDDDGDTNRGYQSELTTVAHAAGVEQPAAGSHDNANIVLPATIQEIASRYHRLRLNDQPTSKQREELWQQLEACNTKQDKIVKNMRGDLVEVKSLLHEQEIREQRQIQQRNDISGGNTAEAAQENSSGESDPVAAPRSAHAALERSNAQPDIGNTNADAKRSPEDLAARARSELSVFGAELLTEREQRAAEERKLGEAQQKALERLVEQNDEARRAAEKAAEEAQLRIQRQADEAIRRLEEEQRVAQLRRQRVAEQERRRLQRYEEEVRHMREVSRRARVQRDAAARASAEREAARRQAIVDVKVNLFRRLRSATRVCAAWRTFVRKRRVAHFLQGMVRVRCAKAQAQELRARRKAATTIQGLFRRAQAQRLRNDLAARRRLKLRMEREEQKRREIAERKKRERDRRHQLRLLEQADARSALIEAMSLAGGRGELAPHALQSAIDTFVQKVFSRRKAAALVAGDSITLSQSDDEVLFSTATALQSALTAELRCVSELQQSTETAQNFLFRVADSVSVNDSVVQEHSTMLEAQEIALQALQDARTAVTAATQRSADAVNKSAVAGDVGHDIGSKQGAYLTSLPIVSDAKDIVRTMKVQRATLTSVLSRLRELAEAADLGHYENGGPGLLQALAQVVDGMDTDKHGTPLSTADFILKVVAVTETVSLVRQATRSYIESEGRHLQARVQTAKDNNDAALLSHMQVDVSRHANVGPGVAQALQKFGMDSLAHAWTSNAKNVLQQLHGALDEIESLQRQRQQEAERKTREREQEERRRRQEAERKRQQEERQHKAALAQQRREEAEMQYLKDCKQQHLEAMLERERVEQHNQQASTSVTHAPSVARLASADRLRTLVSAHRSEDENQKYPPGSFERATKVQALFRGSRIRRRFASARQEIEGLWGDDSDEYGEVDVDAFLDIATSAAGALSNDPDWMTQVFDEIVDDVAEGDDFVADGASLGTSYPRSSSKVADAAARSHRRKQNIATTLPRKLPPLSPMTGDSAVTTTSSRADNEAAILQEWGFKDPATARQMLRRRKKFGRAKKLKTGRRPKGRNRKQTKSRYKKLMAHMGLANASTPTGSQHSKAKAGPRSMSSPQRRHATPQEHKRGFALVKDDDTTLRKKYADPPSGTSGTLPRHHPHMLGSWLADGDTDTEVRPGLSERNLPPISSPAAVPRSPWNVANTRRVSSASAAGLEGGAQHSSAALLRSSLDFEQLPQGGVRGLLRRRATTADGYS